MGRAGGHRVGDLGAPRASRGRVTPVDDLHGLSGALEVDAGLDRHGLGRTDGDLPAGSFPLPVPGWHLSPRQALQLVVQGRLVTHDRDHVVGATFVQVSRVGALGV